MSTIAEAKGAMRLYLIDTCHGVTVREHPSIGAARAAGKREFGTSGFYSAKVATLDELVEVKRAGGNIPFDYRDAVEQHERETIPAGKPRSKKP